MWFCEAWLPILLLLWRPLKERSSANTTAARQVTYMFWKCINNLFRSQPVDQGQLTSGASNVPRAIFTGQWHLQSRGMRAGLSWRHFSRSSCSDSPTCQITSTPRCQGCVVSASSLTSSLVSEWLSPSPACPIPCSASPPDHGLPTGRRAWHLSGLTIPQQGLQKLVVAIFRVAEAGVSFCKDTSSSCHWHF